MIATTMGLLCLNTVTIGCKREAVARTDTEQRIDDHLAGQVKTAFGNSPAFKFPDVQVAAFKGKVQLSGFVVSEDQKRSAETIAKGVPGVVSVENNISMKQ
ncbi:MAG: BON domain-containing protein [Limisphaerales bacterium]